MKSVAIGPMSGGVNLYGNDYLETVKPMIQQEVRCTKEKKIKTHQQKVKDILEKLSRNELMKQYQKMLWMVIKSKTITCNNIKTHEHFIDTGILTT